MLKLIDYRSKAKGLPDLLPYAALIAPGVILNKDGSFLASWEIRGQDTGSSTPDELAFVSAQFNKRDSVARDGLDAACGFHSQQPSGLPRAGERAFPRSGDAAH